MIKTLSSGTIVDDRYEIIEHLGEGGLAVVYSANELALDRKIALKLLHAELIADSDSRLRFEREVKVLCELSHPHILAPIRYGLWRPEPTTPDIAFPYLAMELIEGVSLNRELNQWQALPAQRVFSIVMQICEAMAYAHERNVVHRDLKPSNIMLSKTSEGDLVKVVDFGLARLIDTEKQAISQHLTGTGNLIGSVHYMSPEQCKGLKVDHRSDIYSLGCLMYEMLSGAPPFSADSPIGVVYLHANETVAPLETIKSPCPLPETNAVLQKSLAKLPEQRYQTMNEMLEDIEQLKGSANIELKHARVASSARTGPNKLQLLTFGSLLLFCVYAAISVTRATIDNRNISAELRQTNKHRVEKMVAAIERAEARFAKERAHNDSTAAANMLFENISFLEEHHWSNREFDKAIEQSAHRVEVYPHTLGVKKAMVTADIRVFDRCRSLAKEVKPNERPKWLAVADAAINRADEIKSTLNSPQQAEVLFTHCYWLLDERKITDAKSYFDSCYEILLPEIDSLNATSDVYISRAMEQLKNNSVKAASLSNNELLGLAEMSAKLAHLATVRGDSQHANAARLMATELLSARFPSSPTDPKEQQRYLSIEEEIKSQSKLKQGNGGRDVSTVLFK